MYPILGLEKLCGVKVPVHVNGVMAHAVQADGFAGCSWIRNQDKAMGIFVKLFNSALAGIVILRSDGYLAMDVLCTKILQAISDDLHVGNK